MLGFWGRDVPLTAEANCSFAPELTTVNGPRRHGGLLLLQLRQRHWLSIALENAKDPTHEANQSWSAFNC